MIYAQIKNGIVVNTIQTDAQTNLSLFTQGFDQLIRIDTLSIVPSPKWTYDGSKFKNTDSLPVAISLSDIIAQEVVAILKVNGIAVNTLPRGINVSGASAASPQVSVKQSL